MRNNVLAENNMPGNHALDILLRMELAKMMPSNMPTTKGLMAKDFTAGICAIKDAIAAIKVTSKTPKLIDLFINYNITFADMLA